MSEKNFGHMEQKATNRITIVSHDTSVDRQEIAIFIERQWQEIGEFVGASLGSPRIKKVAVYPKDIEGFWNKTRRFLDISPGSSGGYNPFRQNIGVEGGQWVKLQLAHELGHAAMRSNVLCGTDLGRPGSTLDESFAQAIAHKQLLEIEHGGLEIYRQKLHTENNENMRDYLRAVGIVEKKKKDGTVEKQENWFRTEEQRKIGELLIYLSETKDKSLLRKVLRSVHNWTRSKEFTSLLEETYGVSIDTLRNDYAEWWYGKSEERDAA